MYIIIKKSLPPLAAANLIVVANITGIPANTLYDIFSRKKKTEYKKGDFIIFKKKIIKSNDK